MTDLLYLYIFVLAAFTGYEVISRVPVILHTPLMSGSNFIHGVVLVGAMYALGHAETPVQIVLGFLAVLLGAANAAGGFVAVFLGAGNAAGGYVVTERMLAMFAPKKKLPTGSQEA